MILILHSSISVCKVAGPERPIEPADKFGAQLASMTVPLSTLGKALTIPLRIQPKVTRGFITAAQIQPSRPPEALPPSELCSGDFIGAQQQVGVPLEFQADILAQPISQADIVARAWQEFLVLC
jgi:hypothetical protein